MIVVVATMLACYGGMHYYLFRKLCWIFPQHRKLLALLITAVAISVIAIYILASSGIVSFLNFLIWITAIWLGFIFIFLSIAAFIDLLFWLLINLPKYKAAQRIEQRTRALAILMLAVVVSIYGFVSAQHVAVLSYNLHSSKLEKPLTVVQISDLHLSLLSKPRQIESLVSRINALHPDIIVSTGDLVDMQAHQLNGFSQILAGLQATIGKYAIFGNHEAFVGREESAAFFANAGFELLSNQLASPRQDLSVVGVDDPAIEGRLNHQVDPAKEVALLTQTSSQRFTLLLKHQPVISPASRGLFDLQLSGHTHHGQIFPFSWLVRIIYRAPFGLSQVTPTSWLYVSNGTGTWGPPMRVLAEPEISVFYLRPNSG